MLDTDNWLDEALERSRTVEKPPRPVHHAWLDQWLIARGEPLKQIVGEITQLVASREPQRKRVRSAVNHRNHFRMVEGLVCNLAHAVLDAPPTGWLAVNTRNGPAKTRYDNAAFGRTYLRLLFLLAGEGLLERQLSGAIRGEVSSIRPTASFADLVSRSGSTLDDFAPDPNREVIFLRHVTRTYSPQIGKYIIRKELSEYGDTPVSDRYRAEVRRLNEFLEKADIVFLDDGVEPRIDGRNRSLYRCFSIFDDQNVRFDQVGRLASGFWMSLKRDRRCWIRINGEPVANLDFSSMFTRLAYVELGEAAPDGDLYQVPGLEGYRDGVKKAMNVFLFDETPNRECWPQKSNIDPDDGDKDHDKSVEELLPAGLTVANAKKLIIAIHPALERAWGRGLGYRLMWQESEILMAVLTELMGHNIPALGLHDGLLVPMSKKDIALQVMMDQSKAIIGVALPCSEKD